MTGEGALGMIVEHVPNEAVNRGQARVARTHRITACRLEIREKSQDQILGQVVELQRRDLSVTGVRRESEEQFEGISVRHGGVRTGVVLRGEVSDEKGGPIIPILLGGGLPLLPVPGPRLPLRLRAHRLYKATGTLFIEYDVVNAPA